MEGGGNGHLGHMVFIFQRFQETEMGKEGMVLREIQLPCNAESGGLGLLSFKMDGPCLRRHLLTARQSCQEIQMPEGAAELSVRKVAEAIGLFLLHQDADFPVLHRLKLPGGNPPFLKGSPRILQHLRS